MNFLVYSQTFSDVSVLNGINPSNTAFDNYGSSVSFYDFNKDGLDDLTFAAENDSIFFYLNNGNGYDQLPSYAYGGGYVKQVAWVDIDNDEDFDLFITVYDGTCRLLINDGSFNFTETSNSAIGILNIPTPNYGVSFADYDNDGFLDIYVANYILMYTSQGNTQEDNAHLNQLYRNLGNGTFQNTTLSAGVGDSLKASFQGLWFDHNMDGFLDLFVINDRYPFENSLYENNGDGTFSDISQGSGLEFTGGNPMTATIGDYNNDGYPDIYNTNVGIGHPTAFFVNNGNGTFSEQSVSLGVSTDLYSWGALFIDYDNDTWQDLYVATGHPSSFFPQDNSLFYQNNGGQYFIQNNGLFLDSLQGASKSIAKGDVNNDGYYDIVSYNDNNEEPFLWENSGGTNNYIKLTLEGTASNKSAIGSYIRIYANSHVYTRFLYSTENYIGQDSQHLIFGLAQAPIVDSILIDYPSGITDRYYDVQPNMHHYFTEGETMLYEIATVSGDSLFCEYDTVQLQVNTNDPIEWNTGSTDSILHVTNSGDYYASLDLGAYRVYTDTLHIDIHYLPNLFGFAQSPTCNSFADGEAEVFVNTNLPQGSYSISWSTGDIGTTTNAIPAGTYDFYYEDIFTCKDTGTVVVDEPTALVINTSVTEELLGNDGVINVIAFGGTPPYQYFLDNNIISPPATQLAGGSYELTIKDDNDCQLDSTLIVESSVSIATHAKKKEQPYIYPNPTHDNSVNIFIPISSEAIHVSVNDKIGKELQKTTYHNKSKGVFPFDISSLSPGSYTISIEINETMIKLPLIVF